MKTEAEKTIDRLIIVGVVFAVVAVVINVLGY